MRSPSTVLLRTQSDSRLAALAGAGHDRAFEAIVERYRRPLLRACRRILPEAWAEDALQLALVSAWTALRRGDDVRELRPWLYRIVRNTAFNQLRAGGHDLDELVETLAAAGDPQEVLERRVLVHRTLAAVAALPDRQRDALLRTAIDGHGQEQVARDLGVSSTALRQLVHRARVSVRAAATAFVPWPLAAWLAAAGTRGDATAQRIGELVAAAGTGGAAWAAKAGTVAVIAGSAATAPAVIDGPQERDGQSVEAREPAGVTEEGAEPVPAPGPAAGGGERRRPREDEPHVRERIAATIEQPDRAPHRVASRVDHGHRGVAVDPPPAVEQQAASPPVEQAPAPAAPTPSPVPTATPEPTTEQVAPDEPEEPPAGEEPTAEDEVAEQPGAPADAVGDEPAAGDDGLGGVTP